MIDFEIAFLFTSLIAGVLTILSPCVLPLLPVIIGSTTGHKNLKKPITIIASLGVSIIIFSLLLKASTAFITVPDQFWKNVSGGILLTFGIFTLFPDIWDKIKAALNLDASSNKLLAKGMGKEGVAGDIMIGGALGPVFSSCSPTYAGIVATIIPASFATGFIYLIIYVFGLSIMLMAIAFYGQKLTAKLSGLSNPKGVFKRTIAIIFILVGLAIIFGIDKDIEAWLITEGLYDGIVELENNLTN